MTDYFAAAARIVLTLEGVYSNQAVDPGGETKWGVARKEHPEIGDAQWADWTQADSVALFRAGYWDAHRCGEMPWPWALAIFDGEVNQGSVIRLAQQALGISDDGSIGPQTLAAIARATPEQFQIFMALRLLSYTHDSAFAADGKGWFKRVVAIAMDAAGPPPAN